jgi:hypothetical protein
MASAMASKINGVAAWQRNGESESCQLACRQKEKRCVKTHAVAIMAYRRNIYQVRKSNIMARRWRVSCRWQQCNHQRMWRLSNQHRNVASAYQASALAYVFNG